MTMSSQQRSMTIALWAVLVLVMAGVIGAGVWNHFREERASDSPVQQASPVSSRFVRDPWPTPVFSLTNQSGKTVTSQDLKGHVYVANFIFTSCAGPCPLMTQKLAKLTKAVADPSVRFVSFSVDPERDTPAALSAFAKQFDADLNRWSFLTGPPAAMYSVAQGMKMAAVPQADMSVMHSTYFLLIDAGGNVRGIYHTESKDADEQMEQLVKDIGRLVKESPAGARAAATGLTSASGVPRS